MRTKWLIGAVAVAVAAALGVAVMRLYPALRPALGPPPADIGREIEAAPTGTAPESETVAGPLRLPAGFRLSVVAEGVPGARVMAFDPDGNLWVSQTRSGSLTKLAPAAGKFVVAASYGGFKNPHGLAFDPKNPRLLYLAEETRIRRTSIDGEPKWEHVVDLPPGGRHVTRTIAFDRDGKLYVVVGSTCDVCIEKDPRVSKVHVVENGGLKEFARGLRNAVFIAFQPATGKLWATEMGRDNLGDDLPPDEINVIEEGKNYGWPICYGRNIHDGAFDKNTYIRNPCLEPFETPSRIDLQAHSAPLGLAFAPASWPAEYRGDLFVAFHGSWNRRAPTGYKVVRIRLDDRGESEGVDDFVSGWLTADGQALGRPVDIVFGSDEAMYISDDKAGVIYRVTAK
ncbi:PQQ-dependent sugar dehydrogenase [Candidatus Uhrbacteria bacterium]|nr:PQQ-dependent sugar dehydrogenase [Candidatus Uhrbacteria bacterium]